MDRCYYCGEAVNKVHKEHKHPKYRGGKTDTTNIVISCASCNIMKGWRNEKEFEKYILDLPNLMGKYSAKFRLFLRFYNIEIRNEECIFYGNCFLSHEIKKEDK